MKFQVLRDLTNKIFTSTVARQFVQDDPDDITEATLENDFGPVKLQTGGLFEGYIIKDSVTGALSTSLTLTGTLGVDAVVLKFAVPTNIVSLSKTSQIVYKCDGKLEAPIKFDATTEIPAIKAAELKCQLFEKAVQARIVTAVEAWKAEATTFEDSVPADSFVVPLQ
jgi:hypothetical protein